MKLSEAIHRVDRSGKNTDAADPEVFQEALGLQIFWSNTFGEYVKKHWLATWRCTDTFVGMAVYYMHGEPVAVSIQQYRKSPENLKFVSEAAANQVRDFILWLLKEEESPKPVIANLDEEIGDSFKIHFGDNVVDEIALLDGRVVQIVERPRGYGENMTKVKIRDAVLGEVWVETDNLRFSFRLSAEDLVIMPDVPLGHGAAVGRADCATSLQLPCPSACILAGRCVKG